MDLRLIARLDIKNDRLIKGVHLEGLRVVGDPMERALHYYNQGIDELLLVDAVASLYQRNNLVNVIQRICREIFIPVTVGGGIRSVESAQLLFDAGADKIAINTAAISDPELLGELSNRYGAQAIVLSIQAKQSSNDSNIWWAMTDNGRENSKKSVMDWVLLAQQFGIGEVLITSIDKEGTGHGYDLGLISSLNSVIKCPLLISGGFGKSDDAMNAFHRGAQAVVIAQALHYNKSTIRQIKSDLISDNISMRQIDNVF